MSRLLSIDVPPEDFDSNGVIHACLHQNIVFVVALLTVDRLALEPFFQELNSALLERFDEVDVRLLFCRDHFLAAEFLANSLF